MWLVLSGREGGGRSMGSGEKMNGARRFGAFSKFEYMLGLCMHYTGFASGVVVRGNGRGESRFSCIVLI